MSVVDEPAVSTTARSTSSPQVLGADHVITDRPARLHRARVPAPFPVHRWAEHLPDAVVLPGGTEEVAEIVRIANRFRIPVVPRSGGTGLTDGAVPLRHGILLDLKRLDRIHEIDLENRTCTVGAGMNMLKLNEPLGGHGLIYPDDPASYPCSLVGGRIGTSGWSLIGSRYGHTRDLVLSFVHVLPTGEVIRVGDGGGQGLQELHRLQLKHLFMGHQGTLGVATEATLKLYPSLRPSSRRSGRSRTTRPRIARVRELVRTDCATFAARRSSTSRRWPTCAATTRPTSPSPATVRALVCAVLYGDEDEVRAGGKRLMRTAREQGPTISATSLRGRLGRAPRSLRDPAARPNEAGQVAPTELALRGLGDHYTDLPGRRARWHDIVARRRQRSHVFDDGCSLTPARTPASTTSTTSTSASASRSSTTRPRPRGAGQARHRCGGIEHGGSISACHGACREGEVDLVPAELGGALRGDGVRQADARSQQRHEPGQVRARRRVRGGPQMTAFTGTPSAGRRPLGR